MSTDSISVAVLDRLVALVDQGQQAAAAELRRRVQMQRFRVLVVGEAKRGKSTLINALLGRDVLPMGVIPVTAVMTTVTFGSPEGVLVEYSGGGVGREPLDSLARFVTEAGNPGNRLRIEQVTVLLEAPLVREGVELVDTPGAGSVFAHDREAEKALTTMDAAVFVLTADPPLSASERNLLASVTQASVRTFLVLNKADRLLGAELAEVTAFVADATSELLGRVPVVYPCSARRALEGRLSGTGDPGSGVPRLEADFVAYLRNGRRQGLQQSVARRGRLLAGQALDGVRLRKRLLSMRTEEASARVAAFQRRLDRIGQHGTDAVDLAAAGARRLLEELNESAAEAERTLAATAVARTRRHLEVELAELTVVELRRRGRPVVVETVRELVERWRAGQQEHLEQGLREVEDRLLEGLAAELEGLRSAASDLLGVELTAKDDRSRLVEDPRFFYLLNESVGWNELVTDTIRRHLPGAAARRRAMADLVAEADRLTRQQVGRVRADFQYRLQESGRGLTRAVSDRSAVATAAIRAALADASAMHGRSAGESSTLAAGLTDRERNLEALLNDLEVLLAPGTDY